MVDTQYMLNKYWFLSSRVFSFHILSVLGTVDMVTNHIHIFMWFITVGRWWG
jgi:hypothetical protein